MYYCYNLLEFFIKMCTAWNINLLTVKLFWLLPINNISTDTGMIKLLDMYNLTTDMHLTKNSTVVELTANNLEVEGVFRILILTLVLLSINGMALNKN